MTYFLKYTKQQNSPKKKDGEDPMRFLATTITLLLLTGCSAVDMTAYKNSELKLDLFTFFTGDTKGWGIVQDRKGNLTRQFVVDIRGEVTDLGELVLHEDFYWNDGELSSRTWILSKHDNHNYSGTAADVIDRAAGTLYGNVLNWKYQLNLAVDDSNWKVTFDDWMYKVSEDMLLNKAIMSKFGFTVGEVTIVFQKSRD